MGCTTIGAFFSTAQTIVKARLLWTRRNYFPDPRCGRPQGGSRPAGGEAWTIMDKPMNAHEVKDRIALLMAEETARLLRNLHEIESRMDLVERVVRYSLAKTLH
jgi:hypothetical protein